MKRKVKRGRKSQGQNGKFISLSPRSSRKLFPTYDASQSKPPGSCEADRANEKKAKQRQKATIIHLATYNTRTLRTDEDMEHLLEELKNIKWDIIGLCES